MAEHGSNSRQKPTSPAGRDHSSFRAGDSIYGEGDKGDTLFIIESGEVELLGGPGAARVALLVAGDVFGETSVLEDRPRELAARAVTEVSALQVDRASLDPLLRQSPEVARLLLLRLARRLHEARLGGAPEIPQHTAALAPSPAAVAAAAARSGKLVHSTGEEFALPAEARSVVGRSAKGHVPDIDLAPLDTERSLSRRHAALWREGGKYFVCEEKGVGNGTFVNGQRLAAGESIALTDGDTVAFGLVKTTFRLV